MRNRNVKTILSNIAGEFMPPSYEVSGFIFIPDDIDSPNIDNPDIDNPFTVPAATTAGFPPDFEDSFYPRVAGFFYLSDEYKTYLEELKNG